MPPLAVPPVRPRPKKKPFPIPNFSRPLPVRPQRTRDYSGVWLAWERYADKTELLSQRGELRAYHEDLLRRPPGYTPDGEVSCLSGVKAWAQALCGRCRTLWGKAWARPSAAGRSQLHASVQSGSTNISVSETLLHDPWA